MTNESICGVMAARDTAENNEAMNTELKLEVNSINVVERMEMVKFPKITSICASKMSPIKPKTGANMKLLANGSIVRIPICDFEKDRAS